MSTTRASDQLQQVHELNRVFLGLLQDPGARPARECFGLPPASGRRSLLTDERRFSMESPAFRGPCSTSTSAGSAVGVSGTRSTPTSMRREHELCLSILFAARTHEPTQHVSGPVAVRSRRRRCGAAGARVATRPAAARVRRRACCKCAFRERHWFWHGLVHGDAPGAAPPAHADGAPARVALGWPQRRPPQPTA